MKRRLFMGRIGFVTLVLCLCTSVSQAGVVYDISMVTSPLIGHPAGPFSLEFQLNDGKGTGDANNTATLTNFLFNGGSAVGSPSLSGGASGSLTSGVNLIDNSFFNQFIQGITPGSVLSFRLSLSTNPDSGGTPDEFSFAILDKTGTEIPTLAPSFFDVFVQIDIASRNPLVQTFGTDTSRNPAGGVGPINIAAPTATLVPVPEPTSTILVSVGLAAVTLWKRRSKALRLR
jgi:hypothetical protein